MPTTLSTITTVPTPALVFDKALIEKNVDKLISLQNTLDIKILYALKASYGPLSLLAKYSLTPEVGSVGELLIAKKYFNQKAHGFFVALSEQEWPQVAPHLSHLSFNSVAQGNQFGSRAQQMGISTGLRVNPNITVSPHPDYDAGALGCRFGVPINELPSSVPHWIKGLHMHVLCENNSEALIAALQPLLNKKNILNQLSWLNLGGGHLISDQSYDINSFIKIISQIKNSFPNLDIIIEPGAAWVWQAGTLVTTVRDVVTNNGISSAILDCSFRAHLNDFLIGTLLKNLPLTVRGANYCTTEEYSLLNEEERGRTYRLGGLSCATCDTKEFYTFPTQLRPDTRIYFENMGHYTDVTYSWFNGLVPPSIYQQNEGHLTPLQTFDLNQFEAQFRNE